MRCGDNKNSVHVPVVLEDSPDVIIAYCSKCKKREYFRKIGGKVERKSYHKFFKRDTLQPHENLYYKEYPQKMGIVA